MDWINTILNDPALLAAIVGVLIVVFKDKPVIRQILMAILPIITPKPVSLPQATVLPVVVPTPVDAAVHAAEAIQHYTALCECCKNCEKAKAALKEVWPHLDPLS